MRKGPAFIWMSLLLLVLLLADLMLGSTFIPPDEVISALVGGEVEKQTWSYILFDFRLPRAITAVLVGMGLSVSGLLMQVMFRNPLAGPYVLGISTGASLGVATAVLAGIGFGISWMSSWYTVAAATVGSALVFLIVMIASFRVKDSMTLLIFGLMLGSAASGVVAVMQYFSQAEDIQIYLLWTFGNLGGVTYPKLAILALLTGSGLLLAHLIAKPLNVLLLGESYARTLGIHIVRTRILIIVATCLIAGSITAFCGPIAFIGIAVPHLSRLILQQSDHRVLVPFTLVLGGVVLLLCDIISQLPGTEEILPINAVTAVFGAPLVIWLILKRGNIQRSLQ